MYSKTPKKFTWFLVSNLILVSLTVGLFSFLLTPTKVSADGVYTNLGTADAGDGSNDVINFSQGKVWTIDKFGKYIWLTQTRSGPSSHWTWSNDLGTSWTQGSESYSFLTRGSVAYDSIDDNLHVIWAAQDSTSAGGLIYRRYSITRDGSNNITAIQRIDSVTVNLQMDYTDSNRIVEQPAAFWLNDGSAHGSLVTTWTKYGVNLSEIRGAMRKLTMTAADGVAGNWQALDNTPSTFSVDPPQIAANKIYGVSTTSSAASSTFIRGGTGARKDDLYVFVAESNTKNVLAYRAIWNSANKDWRGGFQSPVTVGTGVDSLNGYNFKQQLISKPVLDSTNDKIYIAWARWKTGGAGDTVSFASLSSTDVVSSVTDVYSANGTHSYAPTFDIAYDNTGQNLYITYIESTTNGDNGSIDYKIFDGTILSSSTRYYTSPGGTGGADGSADIPILYENRSSNNRILVAFRKNGAVPPTNVDQHTLFWGYITPAAPTPTPTTSPPTTTVATTTASTAATTTATTTAGPAAPTVGVSITNDNGSTNFAPGDTLTETITIPNNSGQALTNVFVVSALPSNTTYIASSLQYGSGNSATAGSFTDPTSSSANILSGSNLANGSSLVLTFKIKVSQTAAAGSILGASVSGGSDQNTFTSGSKSVVLGLTNTGQTIFSSIIFGIFLIMVVIIVKEIHKKKEIKLNFEKKRERI